MTTFRRALSGDAGISADGFLRFSRLITEKCGIRMPPQKKTMLETRLRKRLRSLGIESFEEYGEYVFSKEGMRDELTHLIERHYDQQDRLFPRGGSLRLHAGAGAAATGR